MEQLLIHSLMKRIPLTQGKYALVDDEDFESLNKFKWHYSHGYATRKLTRYKNILMHRVIMKASRNTTIDHKNGDSLDDQRENLRFSSARQNMQNRRKLKMGTSIFKGVSKNFGRWRTRIKFRDKVLVIGHFKDEQHAAVAYDFWATLLYGEFAHPNFKVVSSG